MPDTELAKRLRLTAEVYREGTPVLGLPELLDEAGAALSAARAELVQFMAARGYATGHGDTVADMLAELEGQAKGIARAEAIEEAAREFVAATRALAAAGQGEK